MLVELLVWQAVSKDVDATCAKLVYRFKTFLIICCSVPEQTDSLPCRLVSSTRCTNIFEGCGVVSLLFSTLSTENILGVNCEMLKVVKNDSRHFF